MPSASRRVLEIAVVHRVQPAEHHRLRFLVAGQRGGRRVGGVRHRVADVNVGQGADLRHEVSDLSGTQRVARRRRRPELADFENVEFLAAAHQADALALAQRPFHDANVDNRALISVEMAVIDERLERRVGIAGRRRDALDDSAQHLVHADAALAAGAQHVLRIDAEGRFHFGDHFVRPGDGQIDLVQHRHDGQVGFDGEISIGDGLGLHALESVHQAG